MDTIVLSLFVSTSLIGIYEVSWNLASILILAGVSIQGTLAPTISELSVNEDFDQIHHLLNEGLVFAGVFAVPGLFGAVVLGPRILTIYRPEFAVGWGVLTILVLARLIAVYGMTFVNATGSIDRPDVAFRVNLAFIGTNLLLNLILVSLIGWVGAAIATSVSALVVLVLGYRAMAGLIGKPRVPYAEISREVMAGALMAIALLGISRLAPPGDVITVLLVLLGAAVYLLVLLAISSRVRVKARSLLPRLVV